MKRILGLAAVALLAGATVASAQMQQEGNWYVIDQSGGSKLVVGPANPEGVPLLMGESDAAPADCAAGAFWQMADGTVVSCDDDTAMFDMRDATAEELSAMQEQIPMTEPYPEQAQTLMPRESGQN
jgi:hypothetical protein